MTTGHDDTGRRDGGPDLLASLPGDRAAGIDPAAFEELRTAVLEMREELAGLRKDAQAEQLEPVTRDALDAWGEDLLKKLGEAVPNETGSGRAAAAIADHAERTEEAAGRVENALKRNAERFSAEIRGMEEWLAEDRTVIRAATSGIESAAGRIESGLGAFRERADRRFNDIASGVFDTRERVRKLNFDWRMFLAPWAIGMFFAGAVFATVMKLASRLS